MKMTANPIAVEERSYRLPLAAKPSFYDIRIEPDLKAFTFSGQEKILLELKEPVTEIVLNSAEIVISNATLSDDSGTSLVGTVDYDKDSERAIIRFDGTAGDGHWELDLTFTGIINDKLKGFYRSVYKTADGKEEVIATTKFEPCDARRAFPCWDEPAFKARFKLALVIANEYNAISNAGLLKQTDLGNGKKQLEFAPSIPMSSYLVAYVVGKLEASAPVVADMGDGNKKEIRVWSVPGKKHLAGFGLQAAKFSLEYFARYFQQPYPGDKLDLVAIPDFASGAMENFGCITFRETALLVDPKTASQAELERVAEVVMHENAHMWFGDFTTMSWWNGLWLNEAFATFMAAKALDAWKPEWRFWEGFNVQRAAAMRVDGLRTTRSIEFPVKNPEQAREMFDVLTYEKGCAVLRMLELFLGEEKFRSGIIRYIAAHAYGNADTPQLWSAIEEVVPGFSDKVTITDLMNSWVFQPGYPVVSVEESKVKGSVTFSQRIFRYLNDTSEQLPDTLWHIPVHVRATVDGPDGKPASVNKILLLSKREENFYLGENISSLVVNAGGHGFYRVRYGQELRDKLMDGLASAGAEPPAPEHQVPLTASERFNLVNDMWATVQSGQTQLKDYLLAVGIITCTFRETDLNVFTVITGSLQSLRRLVSQEEQVQIGLLNLARSFCTPALNRLGWYTAKAGESSQDGQLRGQLLSLLGVLGDEGVGQWAQKSFKLYQTDKTKVDTNLVGAMVDTLAANGDAALYQKFHGLRGKAATPQEEQRYLFALAQFGEAELIDRTLTSCLDGSVRTQDAPYVVRNVLTNPKGRERGWKFIVANWDKMTAVFPMSGVSRMCDGITALVSPELETQVREFFGKHPVKGGEKAVKQYMEQLSIAVRLKQREQGSLEDLLLTAYQNCADTR
jgi:puromycin-sensitive aminopeptidase